MDIMSVVHVAWGAKADQTEGISTFQPDLSFRRAQMAIKLFCQSTAHILLSKNLRVFSSHQGSVFI